MKKISLKNVKETLSRKEMRVITGGYGGGSSSGCGDFCDGYSDATICNEFGTCRTCGPACTCI